MNTNQLKPEYTYAGQQIARAMDAVLNRPRVGQQYHYDMNPTTKKPYLITVVRVTEKRVSVRWDNNRKISVCKFSFLDECTPINGVTELDGGSYRYNFHQQATCGGIFSLSEKEMSEVTLIPENKKYNTFQIAYFKEGQVNPITQRIEARNHETASNIAQVLGYDVSVEFIPANGDLSYIH